MEQNLNRWFPLENIPGLNIKSLSSVFIVKAYVRLIAICPSSGHIKFGGSAVFFIKSSLMPPPGFSFTLRHLTLITHTLHHHKTYKYNHLWHLLLLTSLYNVFRRTNKHTHILLIKFDLQRETNYFFRDYRNPLHVLVYQFYLVLLKQNGSFRSTK